MRRFIYAVCLFGAIIPFQSKAQVWESDALRYSQDILGGTARFSAMGGAFAAVGGDMSTLAYNPAGIAVYTKNQLEITPGLTLQSTNASNSTQSTTNENSTLNLQSAGLVATKKIRSKDKDAVGWKSYNFGFSYNRLNNFNDNVTIQDYSNSSTYLDYVAKQATQYGTSDQFFANPSYYAGLLDDTIAGQYFNIIHPNLASGNGDYIEQTENIATTGSMGEFDIAFGGNYNNKLFIGASVGIVDVNYNLTDTYSEVAEYTDQAFGFQNYSLTQNLTTGGTGYNVKLGFIYRIFDWLRIGGSVISPTYFSMSDNYSTNWTATYSPSPYFTSGGYVSTYPSSVNNGSPLGASESYNYNLTTPLKAIGGAAVVINNQGIISADYEYVDYSTINVNSSDLGGDYTSALNNAISQDFIQANNLRFGFEWVLYPVSFRAGYAIYGNPYNTSNVGYSSPRTTYSAGIGLKVNKVSFDFAYTLMQYSEQYSFYEGAPTSTLKTNLSSAIFTLAYTFGPAKNHMPHRERFQQAYPPPPPPPPPGAY